jgi:nucleoid DNA-binding protein
VDISKHIIEYLSDNETIVVPGLGRFTTVNKPSDINGNIVTPPVRTVEYDSSQDEDDGVLASYISTQTNISIEQVKAEMAAFYNNLKGKLAAKKTIMLNNLGTLSVNATGDIVFEPESDLFIVRQDSYGLGQVNLQGNTVKTESEPVMSNTGQPTEAAATTSDSSSTTATGSDSGSLFDTSNMRVRENTERRRPAYQKQEPPVKPVHPTNKPQSIKRKPEKKKPAKSGSGFPMWILLVLIIVAGLGVGGYYFYPTLSPYIDSTFSAIFGEKKTNNAQNESLTLAEDTPNQEVGQSLDEATEKKNALNPETDSPQAEQPSVSTPPESTPPVAQPVTQSQPESTVAKTESTVAKPDNRPATQSQGNFGQKRYLLIVGSFTTQTRAETFGSSLRNAGIEYEIIDFGNQRVRVAVAGYDDKTEAFNQANRFKTKPHCEDVWVAKR